MFINLLCIMFSGCSNFVIFFFQKKKPQIFNTCSNTDPTQELQITYREGHIDIFSLVLYTAINVRILIYKLWKKDPGQKCFMLENRSILNLTSLIVNLTSSALLAFTSSKANALSLDEMNQYPYYLLVYSMQLIGPPVVCNIVLGFQFIRHKSLRKFIIDQAEEYFGSQ